MKEFSEILYLYGYTEMDDFEMPIKGYRDDVIVKFSDNSQYRLCFYDVTRLSQDIADEKIICAKGLVIVENLTKKSILEAVHRMIKENYFS